MLSSQTFVETLISYLPLIIGVSPLLAAVISLYAKRPLEHWLATCFLALAMFLGGYLCVLTDHGSTWHTAFTWLRIPGSPLPFHLVLSWHIDFTVAVMVSLTTTINFITHLYALAYIKEACRRYMILTGGFVSAMLAFLMADNLIARFISWELIGLGSYLLVSFWHQQESAARNGTKVWLINQLGSMSLLIGILIIGSELGSFDLTELAVLPIDTYRGHGDLAMARCCLLVGVCAKSAQFPLFSWLPRAMTAPIPASALIHTATIVGAGVYLLASLAPILDIVTLTWGAYLGSLTALMGAYAAVTQQHIKQVLAYSTISQLGYAVMAVSVGASHIGLFHFITHAFGKACLFLCVGVVSRFLLQQGSASTMTMQHMGGLRKLLPGTFWAYLIAACSLVGIPGFAGSLSKEAVLACTLSWAHQQAQAGSYIGYLVPMLGFVSSLLGIVYIGRSCYLVFMGTPRWSSKLTPNVSYRTPWLMQLSMVILALCSFGWLYSPVLDFRSSWLLQRLAYTPRLAFTLPINFTTQHFVTLVSVSTMAFGILFLAIWRVRSPNTLLYSRHKLALKAWHLDTIVQASARRVLGLSRLIVQFDRQVIYGLVHGIGVAYMTLGTIVHWLDQKILSSVVVLIASVPQYLGKAHRTIQQGNLQHALLWMFIGVGLLLGSVYWVTRGLG